MGTAVVAPPGDLFDRFISVFQTHRKTLRPDTVASILRGEDMADILDWLTVVVRTPSTYHFLLNGPGSARLVGENLTGKTVDMLPTNRAGHLHRIYDRMLAHGKPTQTRCVYRFTNGKEAMVDSLIMPTPETGDAGAIYILSSPNFAKARWLADIVAGTSDELTRPNAIVDLSERALKLD